MKYIKSLSSASLHSDKEELLCVHHAGGGASFFYPWAKSFENRKLSALQLPGREELIQEPLLCNMKSVIDTVWNSFVTYAKRSYVLFGHSVGALIAFELLKRASRESVKLPKKLIVSACRAPHIPVVREPIHNLDDKKFIEKIKLYGGISSTLFDHSKELMDIFVPILRADFSLSESYLNSEIYKFPFEIIAFAGKDDLMVQIDSIKEWQRYTSGRFNLVEFNGDHFYMKKEKNRVLEVINDLI